MRCKCILYFYDGSDNTLDAGPTAYLNFGLCILFSLEFFLFKF
jgi:hypothetical protein